MEYEVHKRLLGKMIVAFACERCKEPLKAPLEDAGTEQPCPRCGHPFVTPGSKELEEHQNATRLRQEQAANARLEKELGRQREREREEQQELREQQAAGKRREEEAARRKALLETHIRNTKSRMVEGLKAGDRVFMYDTIYLPVDSVLMEQPLGVFDLAQIRQLGLQGWEVIGLIPRTVGVVTQNTSVGSTFGETWGGGAGGNILGVHALLRKEVTLGRINDSVDDELATYISQRLMGGSAKGT